MLDLYIAMICLYISIYHFDINSVSFACLRSNPKLF